MNIHVHTHSYNIRRLETTTSGVLEDATSNTVTFTKLPKHFGVVLEFCLFVHIFSFLHLQIKFIQSLLAAALITVFDILTSIYCPNSTYLKIRLDCKIMGRYKYHELASFWFLYGVVFVYIT